MKRLAVPFLLGVSGVLLLAIGAGVLFTPHAFFATNGIDLGTEPTHLSEVRAPGGLLFAGAVVILLGAVRAGLRRRALALSALVYLSYGGARLLSFALDGAPSTSLVAAGALELVLGALCSIALVLSGSTQELHSPAEPARAA